VNEDDLAADLDQFEIGDGGFDDPDEYPDPVPVPVDDSEARKLARWLRAAERQADGIKTFAKTEQARIQAWEQDRTAGLTRRIGYLKRAIEGWQRATKTKTFTTPWVVGRLRPKPSRVHVHDEEAFIAWALRTRHLDLIKTTHVPVKTEIGKLAEGAVADAALLPSEDVAEGRRAHAVLLPLPDDASDDELPTIVPGVVFSVPDADGFTIKPVVPPREDGTNPKEDQ